MVSLDGSLPTYVLINPASQSGKGQSVYEGLRPRFLERGIRPEERVSSPGQSLTQLAREIGGMAAQRGEQINLIVLGGDGSLGEVFQGIQDFSLINFAYLPTGSSNDFARDLGQNTAQEALEAIFSRREPRLMDLCRVTYEDIEDGKRKSRFFHVSSGLGFDAACTEAANRSRLKGVLNRVGLGRLIYVFESFHLILTSRLSPMEVEVFQEDGSAEKLFFERCLFAVGMNHSYEGGGFQFCPQADGSDGILDLCVAADVGRLRFFTLFPFAYQGNHVRYRGITIRRGTSLVFRSQTPLFFHTDGEVTGKTRQMELEPLHCVLRFWN